MVMCVGGHIHLCVDMCVYMCVDMCVDMLCHHRGGDKRLGDRVLNHVVSTLKAREQVNNI